MVFVCLLDLSRATLCKRVKNLHIRKHSLKSLSPDSICFDVSLSFFVRAGGFVVKGLPLELLKYGLDLDVVANFIHQIGEVLLISLWRIIVYPPLGLCKACGKENFSEQGHFAGVFMGSQLYLKHNPSLNPPFVRLNPYLSRIRRSASLRSFSQMPDLKRKSLSRSILI